MVEHDLQQINQTHKTLSNVITHQSNCKNRDRKDDKIIMFKSNSRHSSKSVEIEKPLVESPSEAEKSERIAKTAQQQNLIGKINFEADYNLAPSSCILLNRDEETPEQMAKKVVKSMYKNWNIEDPGMIINITGSAKGFKGRLSPKLKTLFRSGLVRAARSSNAIITTGGTNYGVMRHVGKAMREYSTIGDSDKEIPCVGFVSYNKFHSERVQKRLKQHLTSQRLERAKKTVEAEIEAAAAALSPDSSQDKELAFNQLNHDFQTIQNVKRVKLADKTNNFLKYGTEQAEDFFKYNRNKNNDESMAVIDQNHNYFVFVESSKETALSGGWTNQIDVWSKTENLLRTYDQND